MTFAEAFWTIGALIAIGGWLLGLRSWWQEPTFEVLAAKVQIVDRAQGERTWKGLGEASFDLVAFGGARACRIVEWYWFVSFPGGSGVANGRFSPASILLPPKETTKFELTIESVGISVDEDEKQLKAILHIRVDKDWEQVEFAMRRAGRRFELNRLDETLRLHFHTAAGEPRWKRLRTQVTRRLR